ncbi:MAG TPA: ATPase, T2SS/T4P/T4SS family [Gemmataceae bacterium]|jgi:pilus assembly protein CpaF
MIRSEIYGKTLRFFLAPVADLLYEDESVTEVLINGPSTIYCERGGRLERVERRFADEGVLMAAIRNLAEYVHRRIDDEHHSMDARLPEPDRFRVHVIVPPVSRQGPCVSIRKFRRSNVTLEWLISKGALDEDVAGYLRMMVRAHRNLIVSGGTGSGKTSLLNALSANLSPHERILVIEDSSELQLQQPHVLYLEARPPKPDGKGGVSIRDLFVDSLRMRPDRIVVGEVRRGEALDMIQSMLSGHDGAMSTVHASNPLLALVRLETLCLMSDAHMPVYVARAQVASAIQVIVQVNRFSDGSRRLSAISEVEGLDANEKYRLRDLYRFQVEGRDAEGRIRGRLSPTGRRSRYVRLARECASESEIAGCSVLNRAKGPRRRKAT